MTSRRDGFRESLTKQQIQDIFAVLDLVDEDGRSRFLSWEYGSDSQEEPDLLTSIEADSVTGTRRVEDRQDAELE